MDGAPAMAWDQGHPAGQGPEPVRGLLVKLGLEDRTITPAGPVPGAPTVCIEHRLWRVLQSISIPP